MTATDYLTPASYRNVMYIKYMREWAVAKMSAVYILRSKLVRVYLTW